MSDCRFCHGLTCKLFGLSIRVSDQSSYIETYISQLLGVAARREAFFT